MSRAVVKTVAALLAAVAAVVLGLDGADLLPAPAWLVVACITTSATLAAVATIGSAWRDWRERQLGRRRELAEITLTATLWAVVDQASPALDYRDLGIAVYRTARRRWWPWQAELRRVHRVRASRRPVSSDVAWRPGKGVIGACVTRGEVVAVDVAQLSAGLGQPTAAEWRQVPEDLGMGLEHREYLDVRDKYGVVVASPMIDDSGPRSRVVGCLALDGPDGQLAALSSEEVLGLLNSTSQALLTQVGRGVA